MDEPIRLTLYMRGDRVETDQAFFILSAHSISSLCFDMCSSDYSKMFTPVQSSESTYCSLLKSFMAQFWKQGAEENIGSCHFLL